MQIPGDVATPAESLSYILIRWASFTSFVLLIGAGVYLTFVQPRLHAAASGDRADRLAARVKATGRVTSIAVLVLAFARVRAQQSMMTESFGDDIPVALADLLQGAWGLGVALQLTAGVAGFVAYKRSRWGRAARVMVTIAIVTAALVPALSGHAAGEEQPLLPMLADTLHVLAAGAWAGTLLVLAMVVLPGAWRGFDESGTGVKDVLVAFTPIALGSAALLVVTGSYAAYLHVGSLAALTSTRYGQALLWKVGFVVVMVGIGALNWKRLGPVAHTREGLPRLWRSALTESAIALLILAVTAVLVARGTPADLFE
ncbi:MAG: CopD family protein [Gemmatimonadaceae bacterium]